MKLEYKRDKIYDGFKVIANIKNSYLREGSGSKTIANIKDGKIRKDNGSLTLCNVKNNDIRKGTGSSRMVRVRDVRKQIKNSDSLSDEFIAAIWYMYIL